MEHSTRIPPGPAPHTRAHARGRRPRRLFICQCTCACACHHLVRCARTLDLGGSTSCGCIRPRPPNADAYPGRSVDCFAMRRARPRRPGAEPRRARARDQSPWTAPQNEMTAPPCRVEIPVLRLDKKQNRNDLQLVGRQLAGFLLLLPRSRHATAPVQPTDDVRSR